MPKSAANPTPVVKPKKKLGPKTVGKTEPAATQAYIERNPPPLLTITAARPGAFITFDPYHTQGTLHLWLTPQQHATPPLTIGQHDVQRIETGIQVVCGPDYYLTITILLELRGFVLAQYAADGSWLDLQNVNSHRALVHGEALATFRLVKRIPFMVLDTTEKKE